MNMQSFMLFTTPYTLEDLQFVCNTLKLNFRHKTFTLDIFLNN